MKKSIFTIGIALIAFTDVSSAASITQLGSTLPVQNSHISQSDTTTARPARFNVNREKTVEEVIVKDTQITESIIPEVMPINTTTAIDEIIAQDIKITETVVSDSIFPLDFKKINKKADFSKIKRNSDAVVFEN